jgi:hypothetical protein
VGAWRFEPPDVGSRKLRRRKCARVVGWTHNRITIEAGELIKSRN